MIQDFDIVKLKKELINVQDYQGETVSLPAGSLGTVVMIYDKRVGCNSKKPTYAVDFCDETGDTIALLTLKKEDIELHWAKKNMRKAGKAREKKKAS